MKTLLKLLLIVYVVGAFVMWAHSVRQYDCRSFDRSMCRSFAITDGYFTALVWPMTTVFEKSHP